MPLYWRVIKSTTPKLIRNSAGSQLLHQLLHQHLSCTGILLKQTELSSIRHLLLYFIAQFDTNALQIIWMRSCRVYILKCLENTKRFMLRKYTHTRAKDQFRWALLAAFSTTYAGLTYCSFKSRPLMWQKSQIVRTSLGKKRTFSTLFAAQPLHKCS